MRFTRHLNGSAKAQETAQPGKGSFSVSSASTFHACNCIGPQNGEPYCPCKMRGVERRGGRWVEPERDLGPIEPEAPGIWPSPSPVGCICPPTSEQTCQRPLCPRQGIKVSFSTQAPRHG